MSPARPLRSSPTALLLTAGFVLLAIVVAMPVWFAAAERATNARAQNALVAEGRLADLFSTMRQAENGSRGYLITGNPISLDTYNLALAQAPLDLRKLDDVLAGSPYAAELAQLHVLVNQKLAQLAQLMALVNTGNKVAAAALINTDLNLLTMVNLRTLTAQISAAEAASVAADQAEEARDSRLLEAATAFAVLGTILLASFAVRLNGAQTRRLQGAEAALIAANEALEQKVADRTATLYASEARFRLLSESLPGMVYMTDAKGKTLYVNPYSCEYAGTSFEAMLDYGWTGMVHPDDRAVCVARWEASVASGLDYEIEFRLRRHDGTYRWFLDRAVALTNPDGAISAWIGTSIDIDDRKAAESAMADANALLEQRVAERAAELDRIFRISTDILAITNLERRFISVSPAWERITGRPVAEALGRDFMDFVHPEDAAPSLEVRKDILAGTANSHVNRYQRADGSWCWLAWRSVAVPEQRLVYSVARDITAERERDEQLRQSQKMEVVGQLTGGVAHDFNNLLTIIMGSLELLQRGLKDADARLIRRVETAMEGAQRAAALTHRLLAFSRRQPLEPKPLDVNRLLAGMSDMLHRTLGETIYVELVNAAGLWPALADANQLENAILNLAVNARDAMPAGGHLSIETQNTYLDESYVAARPDAEAGQYVMIAVTDTGTGMEPEVQARVFEPFFTTKPQGQGTGLGLAQVYGFIKQSGGHINIYSEPGQGTTVKLYLPRLRGARESAEPAGVGGLKLSHGQGQTVLVVEDEAGVRDFAAEILGEFGYRVLTAESGEAALALCDAAPEIRLLFTDVVLKGGMNGRQLADEALRRDPRKMLLFTTGYTRNAIIHHGRLDEGINFIGKPYTAAALGEKVARLFQAAMRGTFQHPV